MLMQCPAFSAQTHTGVVGNDILTAKCEEFGLTGLNLCTQMQLCYSVSLSDSSIATEKYIEHEVNLEETWMVLEQMHHNPITPSKVDF